MPVYEYECKQCGTRFEKMQSITAEPLTECVNCGGGPVRRVFHPVGVIFKGSGWYVTDNRSSGKGQSKSDSVSSATSESKGDSKAVSKDDGTAKKENSSSSSSAE